MNPYETDVVVIGAGVIGLACAKAMAERGHEVLILEALDTFGSVTSARNSETIHTGLLPKALLKGRLGLEGRPLLYAYCEQRGIPHARCGKLLVVTAPADLPRLESVRQRLHDNGVDDTRWLTATQAMSLEPALRAVAAIACPSSGIVDSHAYMTALLGDAEAHGARLICRSPVLSAEVCRGGGTLLRVGGAEPATLRAGIVINAAGLHAPELARRFEGLPAEHIPDHAFSKGNVFSLRGKAPFSRLISPIRADGQRGIALKLDLGGQTRFGPDVEDLDIRHADDLDYRVDAARADRFYAGIRQYWPGLEDGALQADFCGVRPKLRDAKGLLMQDYVISGPADHGCAGLVNLFGIESPGLTASLAIAQFVARLP